MCCARIERGCAVSAADYVDMVRDRARLVRAMDARLAALDVLVMPTTAIVAPTIAEVADPKVFAARNMALLRNTNIINFFDLCAISLPLPRLRCRSASCWSRAMAKTTGFYASPRQWRSFLAHDRCLPQPRQFPSISANQGEDKAMNRTRMLLNRRQLLAPGRRHLAAPAICVPRAGLKVGVLLPRSGFEASIGQDCQRGVEIAPANFKSMGLPELAIMDGDTESTSIPPVLAPKS